MVDFVKCWYQDALAIKENPLLDFRLKLNTKTGEIEPFEVAKYRGMKFKVWNTGFLEISGSLHKFKNEGLHNYDDFTYSVLCEVLHQFVTLFGLDLKKCELHNIEFGVNIIPFMGTGIILDNLISHKNISFDSLKNGNYKQAKHGQYFCKLYNKAIQYNLTQQLMRWELKFVKMEKLKYYGIYSLDDLLKSNWIEPIGALLLKEWDNILMFDNTLEKAELDPKIRELKILQWSNSIFWKGLSRMQKNRELKLYNTFLAKHSQGIQERNKERIKSKLKELYSVTL